MFNNAYNQQQFPPTDRGAILSGLRRGQSPEVQGYNSLPPRHAPFATPFAAPGFAPQQYPAGYGQQAPPPQSYSSYGQPPQQQGAPDVAAMMQQLRLQASRDIEQLRQRTADMTAVRRTRGRIALTPQAFMAQQQQEQQRQAFSGAVFSPPMPHGQFNAQPGFGHEGPYGRPSGGMYTGGDVFRSPPLPMGRPAYPMGQQQPSMGTPPLQQAAAFQPGPIGAKVGGGAHHRHQSSVGSSGSSVLSAGGILSSPSGPSVVLSKPGEPYPPQQLSSPTKAGAATHAKRGSDASSSGSGSESFDSLNTSVSSGSRTAVGDQTKIAAQGPPQLRPDATSFSPKVTTSPSLAMSPPMRFGNGSGQRQPLQLASRRAGGNAAGQPNALGVSVIRQPRGAIASDEPDFAAQNFASQQRKQGRHALGLLSRRTASPGPSADESLQHAQQQILAQMQMVY